MFLLSTNLYPAGNPQRRAVVQNQTGGLMSNISEEIKDQQRNWKTKNKRKIANHLLEKPMIQRSPKKCNSWSDPNVSLIEISGAAWQI
jgi:hypothetical protein